MIDPLFFTLMTDPVVLSSGYVMDRSTVVAEEDGAGSKLKFHTCPFTRVPLEQSVYPLIYLRRKIFEFKQAKIETMMETARVLLDRGGDSLKNFWEVIDKCESFIDEIGDTTYIHLASRLASLSLEAYDAQNENKKCDIVLVTPTRLATILGRLYRGCPSLQKACNDDGKGESEGDIGEALDDETKANYENFRKRVADLVVCANNSIDDKKFDEAAQWIEACEMVYSSCSNLNMITLLSVAKLHLKLAKARDDTDLLPLRRRVYMEMTISDPDGVARFCDEEGLSIDDLRDLRPIVLYKESIRAVTNDDVWHSAIRSGGLEGEVAAVMVHAGTFEDQGWGNEKGNLGLALYDNEGGLVTRCNLFGTYRASGYSYGNHPARILHAEDDIVSKARPGFQYALEFTVGGGGGHRLNVKAWYCKIFFVNSSFDASRIGTYYMADPEGDDGLYIGQLDANGKSDGKGELVYYDKDIFVGKFEYGSMVEGVLYNGTRALDTMVNGRWTYNNFENGMVERYPYDVVLSADVSDDPWRGRRW